MNPIIVQAEQYLNGLGPAIDLSVAVCDDYSRLLRGEHGKSLPHSGLLTLAASRGRVLLSGRGGAGKSTIMRRLVLDGAAAGYAVALIDLSQWDHAATAEWKFRRDGVREPIDFLLRRFGGGSTDIADLEFLPAGQGKLILIDGLNETPGSIADDILSSADQIASLIVNCSVVISDRLVRRRTNGDERWYFTMPLNVDSEVVRKLVDVEKLTPQAQRLLDSPFFVDKAIKGELKNSPLATIRDFVEHRGKLDAKGLAAAAEGAFAAYREDASRTFDRNRFPAEAGIRAAETLIEGGVLLELADGRVAFNHHWIHDYLASRHVASHSDLWAFARRHASLDALTFKANSFDAIAFVLEQLSAESKDEFLRAVFDWNPYAAGYALAEAEEIAPSNISDTLRTIILAMLAEKKFDRHFLSAQKAVDALELFSDDSAVSLRNANDLSELVAIIKDNPLHSEVFDRWRSVFAIGGGEAAPEALVNAVKEEDSIIGWTAANVLKRLELSPDQVMAIVDMGRHEQAVVRWRAVHVMGSLTDDQVRNALLDRLKNDEDENVRYGSIRSLVEQGSRSSDLATRLVGDIRPLLDVIAQWPRVMTELTRAVFLSRGCIPENWSSEIAKLFYARLDAASETTEIEAWSKLASDLRQHDRLAA
ncbi:HEAT repeat domain-containing protein [Enhydrobacter sp.]|jgi:HEAT repeat protein|uniref:HEAT repeat domain-containing protein n=1 Tax=Enhydrobacter sp. TaxID=1894999 RepID=UPI00261F06C5|nr:HEAT repeat domain-containing protein [Enhydrobacter sp.]WIM12486.1 MAG: hypothetical protein OJF58_003448 [Enhydrobacter sp.]